MSQQHAGPPRKLASELNTWTKQRPEAALEPDLPIIDTHHHLWDDKHRGRYLIHELAEDTGTLAITSLPPYSWKPGRCSGLMAQPPCSPWAKSSSSTVWQQ